MPPSCCSRRPSSSLFACDTITSRIILRFCYSATALRCFLPVNVAKLMPFDYIASHEYKEHTIIAPSSSHLRTYSFHSNYSSFPPQLPRQSSSFSSRIVAYQITISNRSEGKEAKSLFISSSTTTRCLHCKRAFSDFINPLHYSKLYTLICEPSSVFRVHALAPCMSCE